MINEDDDWSQTGTNFSAPDVLALVQKNLEQQPVIIEHRFYRSAKAPSRLIFDEYEDFQTYLASQARPGDQFFVWGYDDLCKNDNTMVSGKYPDVVGRTPRGGVY